MALSIAIVGGGASGLMAGIIARRNGANVTIFESNDRIGKKILSTGNGKCNLTNMEMSPECFHSNEMNLVSSLLTQFGCQESILFFEELGLLMKEKKGYVYPYSEQATSVLDVLRFQVQSLMIEVNTNVKIVTIEKTGRKISIGNGKEQWTFDHVILTTGGMAASKLGSDGSGLELAKKLGHRIIPAVPALGALVCKEDYCKAIGGVRAECKIGFFEDNKLFAEEMGEVQFTNYGISGIPVFQASRHVNYKLRNIQNKPSSKYNCNESEIIVVIDFFPHMEEQRLQELYLNRLDLFKEKSIEELFTGLLHKKIILLILNLTGLQLNMLVKNVKKEKLMKAFEHFKHLKLHVVGNQGFEQAQVCAGGIDLKEVTEHLESTKLKGLYFAGEILEVDGRCGGYNLQWAWTSGYIAGNAASNCVNDM